jgi:thymidylate kinase
MEKNTIIITVTGSDHTGKSSIIAAIAHRLEELGSDVQVQMIGSIPKKISKSDEVLMGRIKDTTVLIMEQQT